VLDGAISLLPCPDPAVVDARASGSSIRPRRELSRATAFVARQESGRSQTGQEKHKCPAVGGAVTLPEGKHTRGGQPRSGLDYLRRAVPLSAFRVSSSSRR
jgi:hypothetical protein